MPRPDVQPLREILHSALKRYLTVRPRGFEIQPAQALRPNVEARILNAGAARTLYQDRKPRCRSLDAVHPLDDHQRTCAQCPRRSQCTPQVRLDLFVDAAPFQLLLAHTSARNFLVYEARLRQQRQALEHGLHRITVINRGSWGELRFSRRD
jgi:hypothetical protein